MDKETDNGAIKLGLCRFCNKSCSTDNSHPVYVDSCPLYLEGWSESEYKEKLKIDNKKKEDDGIFIIDID